MYDTHTGVVDFGHVEVSGSCVYSFSDFFVHILDQSLFSLTKLDQWLIHFSVRKVFCASV